MAQSAEHSAADKNHAPYLREGDDYNCASCGLAVMSDGRNHGFDSDYDTTEEPMNHKAHEHFEFNISVTRTFGLDEANELTSISVEGPEFMSVQFLREFAYEALASHTGTTGNEFRLKVIPLSVEQRDEDRQEAVFDVNKRSTFLAPTTAAPER